MPYPSDARGTAYGLGEKNYFSERMCHQLSRRLRVGETRVWGAVYHNTGLWATGDLCWWPGEGTGQRSARKVIEAKA